MSDTGRWTILQEFRKNGKKYYKCRCECGTVRDVQANSIRIGRSQSCGCLRSERAVGLISRNSEKRLALTKVFNTNFNAIEREAPNKNNKCGHKGVHWCSSKGIWRALIYVQKKCIYLGGYHNIEDAIRARKEAELKYHAPLIEAKRAAEISTK